MILERLFMLTHGLQDQPKIAQLGPLECHVPYGSSTPQRLPDVLHGFVHLALQSIGRSKLTKRPRFSGLVRMAAENPDCVFIATSGLCIPTLKMLNGTQLHQPLRLQKCNLLCAFEDRFPFVLRSGS